MDMIIKLFRSHIKKYWAYYVLGIIELVLFTTNYKPGTFLVGWDNLFPEFNFSLNLKRSFFAVWQEYRGMGVVDNMSHASTIIEDLERLILSLILPMSLVRWVYLTLLHLIGGLGVFHLLHDYVFRKEQGEDEKNNKSFIITGISLLAALFYQYNLGTIQQMYLPMEVFVVHFAYLPWLIWAVFKYLHTNRRTFLMVFAAFSILATPQAHVPTIFIVYAMSLGIILTSYIALVDRSAWKKALHIVLITFATNAFWFLPFVYAALTHSQVVADSKAFQMASNDIFYRNHQYGNLKDIALIKGTLLEYYYYNFKTHSNQFMFGPWLSHINSLFFQIPAWLGFFMACFGVFSSRKYKQARIVAGLFLFSIFMLGTDIPIIDYINALLREHVPLFKTVFRFVFTKFSILYVFSFSIMFAVGAAYISELFSNIKIKTLYLGILALVIIAYIFPSFQGYFFYDNLRVDIPKKYFKTFAFFNEQDPNTRVAMLPAPWYWSWLQPNWGTINSGFIWYGIPQPTTDLAFTPWSDHNENFYWELDRAITLEDIKLVESVLKKYDITWIYLDKDIMNAESRKVNYSSLDELFAQSSLINRATSFDNTDIYRFDMKSSKSFVSIEESLPTISYNDSYLEYDRYFETQGSYQKANDEDVANEIYPYFSLFSGKAPYINSINVNETSDELIFNGLIMGNLGKNPKITNTLSDYAPQNYRLNESFGIQTIQPKATLRLIQDDVASIEVAIDKKRSLVYSTHYDIGYASQKNTTCDTGNTGTATLSLLEENNSRAFQLTSINSSNCINVDIPNLELRYGYVMKIEYASDLKRGWFVNIYNQTRKKSILETYLRNNGKKDADYFILPPQGMYELGYSIYFNNKSEGVEKVTNTLHRVEMYQIPYREMRDLHVNNTTEMSPSSQTLPTSVEHQSPYKYTITSKDLKGNQTVVLHQGFDPGWKAYKINSRFSIFNFQLDQMFPMLFGEELKDHVLVNNWANGWNVPKTDNQSSTTYVLVFWPQYLQFFGFGMLLLSLGSVFFITKKRDSNHSQTKITHQ